MENTFEEETFQVLYDALEERYQQVGALSKTGLTRAIRGAATLDYAATNKAWGIVEKNRIQISEGKQEVAMDKETLNVLCEALRERAQQTGDIRRSGLTSAIRQAATEDNLATYKAWEKVEKELRKHNVDKAV